MKRKQAKIAGFIAVSVVAAALLWLSTMCVAYTDLEFVCEHTGSVKGYREWFWGPKTKHFYRKSSLERFMEETHPDLLSNQWTSFSGNSCSLVSLILVRGHGYPGPIFRIPRKAFEQYTTSQTDQGKLDMYLIFSGSDREAIVRLANHIKPSKVDCP